MKPSLDIVASTPPAIVLVVEHSLHAAVRGIGEPIDYCWANVTSRGSVVNKQVREMEPQCHIPFDVVTDPALTMVA